MARSLVSKKKIESIVLVTEANRKFCIVVGRKCYAYKQSGSFFQLLGHFIIRPRLKKGWYHEGDSKTFISQDEDREEYANGFRSVIDLLIKEKKLYINQSEALITIKQNDKK